MKMFVFRLSRLISVIFITIIVIYLLLGIFAIFLNFEKFIYELNTMSVLLFKYVMLTFLIVVAPILIILLFNWLTFGKLSLWLKNPNYNKND